VLESGGLEAEALHVVGHSTGGLDARLLVSPGVQLRPGDDEARVARRMRTVVTVTTPHRGSPVANYMLTVQGRKVLEILTILATTSPTRYAAWAASGGLGAAARVLGWAGHREGVVDVLSKGLLDRLSPDRTDPVWKYLDRVSEDQGAIVQLTPESMDVFNAAVTDRMGVAYGCVVAAAPPPPRGYTWRDALDIERVALGSLFVMLHTMAAREHRHYPYPVPDPRVVARLEADLGFPVGPRNSDGLAPLYSQLHGRVLAAVRADHLDVVGQYQDPAGRALRDWLPSGSHFDAATFDRLWDRVAAFLVEGHASWGQREGPRAEVAEEADDEDDGRVEDARDRGPHGL
jgi:triacylglycerol lipase